MAENGFIKTAEAADAKAKPLEVKFRQSGAHIFAAEYFAEEVRRSLHAQYGEEKLYAGGLSVRTTSEPTPAGNGPPRADRRPRQLRPRPGLARSRLQDRHLRRLGRSARRHRYPSDILPWRLGVVLQAGKDKPSLACALAAAGRYADQGSRSGRNHAGRSEVGQVPATKATPKAITDILAPATSIYIAPKDPRKLDGVWSLMQIPEVGGGLVAMDPHTGRVLAVAGGFSFSMSQFDRVIQAKRQPGSSFKPFVYAAALDNGYKPTSIILDAPIEIEQGPGQDIWKPENYDKEKSFGPTTLRVGVEKSRNQMTVRLAQDVGMPIITEYAKRFGIYDDLLPVLFHVAWRRRDERCCAWQRAYCMLANGGKQVPRHAHRPHPGPLGPLGLKHDARECAGCVADTWNEQSEPEIPDDRKQIIDPHSAYQMTSILEGVVQRGTATVLKSLNRPIAGKTAPPTKSATLGSSAIRPISWWGCSSASIPRAPWARAVPVAESQLLYSVTS